MKVIIAHPGRQHSFRLASALKKENYLLSYVTTLYNKDNSLVMKILKLFLSKDNQKRANGRKNPDLNDEDVLIVGMFGGLVEAFLTRVDRTHRVYRFFQRYNAKRFGVKVAKLAIKEKADAVIMYDTNALDGFIYLRQHAPQIKRILDTTIAARPFIKKVYQEEVDKSGNDGLFRENSYLLNKDNMIKLQSELEVTEYFLAASSFVRDSLIDCGILPEQVKQVPYGANVISDCLCCNDISEEKIEFLFVGQVNYRKGVPYLFKAMTLLTDKNCHLTITGAFNQQTDFIKNHKVDNVTFTGLVTPDKMKAIYEKSHVFVLPSFAEGMAQVGIEAMACGLPLICTYNSGLSDLVEEGVTGFIVPAGDDKALVEKMEWFIEHPEQIKIMGEKARKVAKNYTWENYHKNVVEALKDIAGGNL